MPGRKIAELPGPVELPEDYEGEWNEEEQATEDVEDITDELLEDTEPLPFSEDDGNPDYDYDYEEPQEDEE